MLPLVVLALLMALAWFAIHRQAELAMLSVRDGHVLLVRGALPHGMLTDLREALRHERAGSLVLQRQSELPRVIARGLSDSAAQRIRNLVGLRRPTEFRNAKPPARRSLGQRLGWSWLAWREHERSQR